MKYIALVVVVSAIAAVGLGQPVPVLPPGSAPATFTTTVTSAAIRAGCTPDSMSVAAAGSIAATELGRWTCYARNESLNPEMFSHVGFSLDFIELHQAEAADVVDIFNQKQKMSKAGKAARVLEVAGVVAGITVATLATGGVVLSVAAVAGIGAGTYGAGKLGDYFNKQIPVSANALANQWGPAETVMLSPGQGIVWKVYASKMHGATQLGPKMLTRTPMPAVNQ